MCVSVSERPAAPRRLTLSSPTPTPLAPPPAPRGAERGEGVKLYDGGGPKGSQRRGDKVDGIDFVDRKAITIISLVARAERDQRSCWFLRLALQPAARLHGARCTVHVARSTDLSKRCRNDIGVAKMSISAQQICRNRRYMVVLKWTF